MRLVDDGVRLAAAGMVVDVLYDYLWCNRLLCLPSDVMTDRTSVLAALENGGNEFDALRDKLCRPPANELLRAKCLHERRLGSMDMVGWSTWWIGDRAEIDILR